MNKYDNLWSYDEQIRQDAFAEWAKKLGVDPGTKYSRETDILELIRERDSNFNPTQLQLLVAIHGVPKLQEWYRRYKAQFPSFELYLIYEFQDDLLHYTYYLFPQLNAPVPQYVQDKIWCDHFAWICGQVDDKDDPFAFDKVSQNDKTLFVQATGKMGKFDAERIATLNKPLSHVSLNYHLIGIEMANLTFEDLAECASGIINRSGGQVG